MKKPCPFLLLVAATAAIAAGAHAGSEHPVEKNLRPQDKVSI
jgi:hypothetical protein